MKFNCYYAYSKLLKKNIIVLPSSLGIVILKFQIMEDEIIRKNRWTGKNLKFWTKIFAFLFYHVIIFYIFIKPVIHIFLKSKTLFYFPWMKFNYGCTCALIWCLLFKNGFISIFCFLVPWPEHIFFSQVKIDLNWSILFRISPIS